MSAGIIEQYSFGRMVVDGRVYSNDLIILPDQVIRNWWRKSGHNLNVDDLKSVFSAKPEILIIGTGASGFMNVPEATIKTLKSTGIEVYIAKTGDAWRLYNEQRLKRRTAGAFHLTC
jgi:hypothetical protein